MVKFDKSKTSLEQVVAAINEAGYKVSNYKVLNQEEIKK
jgi:copper chaperone CopZ